MNIQFMIFFCDIVQVVHSLSCMSLNDEAFLNVMKNSILGGRGREREILLIFAEIEIPGVSVPTKISSH